MATIQEMIKEEVKSKATVFSPKQQKEYEEYLTKVYLEGKKPYEAAGYSKELLDYLYVNGYNYYKTGHYKEARRIFYALLSLDPGDFRYVYGVAACYHMLKNYDMAIFMYVVSLLAEKDTPLVYYHLSDCYLKQGSKRLAAANLKLCFLACGNNPYYEPIRIRAERLYQTIYNEIQVEEKAKEKVPTPTN